jgi:cobyrinic acid a,c-diamide synthase
MPCLPRLAAGTIQPGAEAEVVLWSLIEAFRQSRVHVQSFLSRASLADGRQLAAASGIPLRHLDSWLMSPETCREVFVRGAQGCDLALVHGKYDAAFPGAALPGESPGGRLETLCRWLSLPRLVVLDAAQIDRRGVPERPGRVDGLLLDRVIDRAHFARLATSLEALWNVPVLGALEQLPRLRARLLAVARGERPGRRVVEQLGWEFAQYWQPELIWRLAAGRELPDVSEAASIGPARAKLTVAIAYDEAFNAYFQDTLDLLELCGASLVDFSPLRDESLPPGTDVVYLGCGHPEHYAAALSENHCIKAALRSHLAAGRRVYAEGGGAAYLCEQMETPEGGLKRMVGVFPAAARLRQTPVDPVPIEVTVNRPSWLHGLATRLRGYRNSRWEVQPLGRLTGFVAEPEHRYDLMGSFQAIGSMLHLDFAARPKALSRFFYPQAAEPSYSDPWAAAL